MVADLPVGENLQDHISIHGLEYTLYEPITITANRVASFWVWLDYTLFGTGWLSSTLVEGAAYLSTASTKNATPNVELDLAPWLIGNKDEVLSMEKTITNGQDRVGTHKKRV